MDLNFLWGGVGVVSMSAVGVSALLFYRKNMIEHEPPKPAPAPQLVMDGQVVVDRLHDLTASFARVCERILQPPEWSRAVLERLERIQEQMMTEPPPPTWPTEMMGLLERACERLEALPIAPPLEPAVDITRPLTDLSQRIEELRATIVLPPVEPKVDALGDVLAQLPSRLGNILAAERRTSRTLPEAGNKGSAASGGGATGDGGKALSPRRPPRNLPRIPPGALPATPQIPAAYVGGSIYVPAGEVINLLLLIQLQLSPNCPGSSSEFSIAAEDEEIFVGAASQLGGPLSADNYAYQLTSESSPRIYRSSYPGNNTPIGELQVLAPAGGYLHVEVQS